MKIVGTPEATLAHGKHQYIIDTNTANGQPFFLLHHLLDKWLLKTHFSKTTYDAHLVTLLKLEQLNLPAAQRLVRHLNVETLRSELVRLELSGDGTKQQLQERLVLARDPTGANRIEQLGALKAAASGAPVAGATTAVFKKMTNSMLKDALRGLGLPTTGNGQELAARLALAEKTLAEKDDDEEEEGQQEEDYYELYRADMVESDISIEKPEVWHDGCVETRVFVAPHDTNQYEESDELEEGQGDGQQEEEYRKNSVLNDLISN